MKTKHFTPETAGSAASKFGQMIGEAFERVVFQFVSAYLEKAHREYTILAPEEGSQVVTLQTFGGTPHRLDTVIVAKDSQDPIALLETKWLKDARHHNDKGAWILQLREMRNQYATVRGAVAILAGYWTEGVGIMLASNAGVKMVLVATDAEVYSTLQKPLDTYLGQATFLLDPVVMRKSYPNAHHLANLLIELDERHQLDTLAESWFDFARDTDQHGNQLTGGDKIRQAIDDLLQPLPDQVQVTRFDIALQINTGNRIYQEFEDLESLCEFLQTHLNDPDAIRKRITPRKTPKQPDQE